MNRFRVAYRRSLSEPWQYEPFDTLPAAYRRKKELRKRMIDAFVQHWNAREERWIG